VLELICQVWGLLLISPASSAALAIALSLDGVAGGAALAGCTGDDSWDENHWIFSDIWQLYFRSTKCLS
jgi:hypothetical protein